MFDRGLIGTHEMVGHVEELDLNAMLSGRLDNTQLRSLSCTKEI
jgi:hypothetical protein